jgi:hypothetical protein
MTQLGSMPTPHRWDAGDAVVRSIQNALRCLAMPLMNYDNHFMR